MVYLDEFSEFDSHRGLFSFVLDIGTKKTRGFVGLHRGNESIPAFGATRYARYAQEEDAIQDVLRLSRMMSYKSAFAKVKYAGAKAVILDQDSFTEADKKKFLIEYARAINLLRGAFVTGSDVGLSGKDVKLLRKHSEYIVGAKIDATTYTGKGLNAALRASLPIVFETEDLSNKTIAIQGLGKVGQAFLDHTVKEAKQIFVTDTDQERLVAIAKKYKTVHALDPEEIFSAPADIFAPCALAGALTPHTAQILNAKLVLGGANNQLSDLSVADLLHSRGITYIPDYVANAGGFLSVVHEYDHGGRNIKKLDQKIAEIGKHTKQLLKESQKKSTPPAKIADGIAEEWIKHKY